MWQGTVQDRLAARPTTAVPFTKELFMHARFVPLFTARFVAAALVALSVVACEHFPAAPGVLASITVERNPDTLSVGGIRQFRAKGFDANGSIVGFTPTWSVATGGGTINPNGVFTAGAAPGTFAGTIVATSGSLRGSATVTVVAGGAVTATITPNPATLAIGATQQFVAVFKDVGGNVVPSSPNWFIANGGGTINTTGLFTAGTLAGTFSNTVTVTNAFGITASATVIVTPGALTSVVVTPNPAILAIGATQQFTATGKDANGNVVAFTPNWSLQAGGGTINATGLFTAGTAAGTFVNTVRACSTAACAAGSMSGFATVTVNPGALVSIAVTPNPVNVSTLAQQQFVATGSDANGNVTPILPLPTWSVKAGLAGGTINTTGRYTAPAAVGVGVDTVVATSGTISGVARVNVRPSVALVTISITPNPGNVVVNGGIQFTAKGTDISGLVVLTPGLTWSIIAGGGTIDAVTGFFTAGPIVGSFPLTVKATSGTVSGFADVNVTAAVVAGINLGTAATHGILAGSSVTCASNTSVINGNVSVSPGTNIDLACTVPLPFAKHSADGVAAQAQADALTAYLAVAAFACGTTITADLGGTTLLPGTYCTGSSVGVTGPVTLNGNGDPNAIFIIRAGSTLTTAGSVVLIGGAQAKNVFWWAGTSATLGVGSNWQGNVMASSSVTLASGVTLIGRALALNAAVSLNGINNTITLP